MKVITSSNGKKKIKISRKEWNDIGKKAGWMRTAKINYPANLLYTIEIDGIELDLSVDVTITGIGNTGIGHYEFWGSKAFDKGEDYLEDFVIDDVTIDDFNTDGTPKQLTPNGKQRIIDMLYQDAGFKERLDETVSPAEIHQSIKDAKEGYA